MQLAVFEHSCVICKVLDTFLKSINTVAIIILYKNLMFKAKLKKLELIKNCEITKQCSKKLHILILGYRQVLLINCTHKILFIYFSTHFSGITFGAVLFLWRQF